MFQCGENFSKPKRYIQFNDLVFLGTKSIEEQDESISLRESKTSRTFANGSYVANTQEMSLIDSNTISLKIALRTEKWSEEHVQAHYEFIMQQLMTPGKLWAIQSGLQLVWCHARVTSIQNSKSWVITDDDYLVFNVEFDNPDGVWYKADEKRVYLEDYSNCDFLEMKANCLATPRLCANDSLFVPSTCECCSCKCDDMSNMVDLCTAQAEVKFMNDFYRECNSNWRVVYNCEKHKEGCSNLSDGFEHVICDLCANDFVAGEFMSLTALPSHKWSLALFGDFKDPVVTLNGKDVKIKGEYSGVVTLNYKGEMTTATSWDCLEYDYEDIPLERLDVCEEMPTIGIGMNSVSVYGVTSESACIYIDYERLTV